MVTTERCGPGMRPVQQRHARHLHQQHNGKHKLYVPRPRNSGRTRCDAYFIPCPCSSTRYSDLELHCALRRGGIARDAFAMCTAFALKVIERRGLRKY